jgi:hypothetical protein
MMSRARQTDYKKIHTGSVASSMTMARRSMKFMQRHCPVSGFCHQVHRPN